MKPLADSQGYCGRGGHIRLYEPVIRGGVLKEVIEGTHELNLGKLLISSLVLGMCTLLTIHTMGAVPGT